MATAREKADSKGGPKKGVLVFCLDISGSMDQMCNIPKSHLAWKALQNREDNDADAGRVLVKSRLGCIKEAIVRHIKSLATDEPEKIVALVTFDSTVTIYKDLEGGKKTEIKSKIYNDYDGLIKAGKTMAYKRGSRGIGLRPVSHTAQFLVSTIEALRAESNTALGPALAVCVGIVARRPGSEIILCTDGAPNSGVGDLAHRNDSSFYFRIGEEAKSNGTVIHLLAVEGEQVGLNTVKSCCEISGGNVDIMNPVEMTRHIRSIGQDAVLATGVSVTMVVHKDLVLNDPKHPKGSCRIMKEVGTAKHSSALSFFYSVKNAKDVLNYTTIPFQVQIRYTLPNGMQCVRVMSERHITTRDKEQSEREMNVGVLGAVNSALAAQIASDGRRGEAQQRLLATKALLERGAHNECQRMEEYNFRACNAEMYEIYEPLWPRGAIRHEYMYSQITKSAKVNMTKFVSGDKKNVTSCKPAKDSNAAF